MQELLSQLDKLRLSTIASLDDDALQNLDRLFFHWGEAIEAACAERGIRSEFITLTEEEAWFASFRIKHPTAAEDYERMAVSEDRKVLERTDRPVELASAEVRLAAHSDVFEKLDSETRARLLKWRKPKIVHLHSKPPQD